MRPYRHARPRKAIARQLIVEAAVFVASLGLIVFATTVFLVPAPVLP